MPGRLPQRRPVASQAEAVQPVPHGPQVGAEFAGDLAERPSPLHHPVGEMVLQGRKAEPGRLLAEVLIGGAASVDGGHDRLGWALDAGLGEQAVGNGDGGAQFAGRPWQAGILLAACRQVLAEVGKAVATGALIDAAMLGIRDREATADGEPAGPTRC
jgi:hypothetical protein